MSVKKAFYSVKTVPLGTECVEEPSHIVPKGTIHHGNQQFLPA